MSITQRLARLIDVKSLVTLCLIALFFVQTVCAAEISQTFLYLLTSVVTFYFAKKDGRTDGASPPEGAPPESERGTAGGIFPAPRA